MLENIIFLGVSFLAAMVATVAGFGASTVLVPVATYFMGVKVAIFFVAIFHLVTNIFKIRLFFKSIDRRIFLFFGIPSIIFAFIGAQMVSYLPEDIIQKTLAVFLIVFSVGSFLKPNFSVKPNPFNTLLGGSLSGFFAGLVGLGGAMRGAFLVSFNLPKEAYIATSSLIAFVVDTTRIPVYSLGAPASAGDGHYWGLLPFLVLAAYFGTYFGKKFLDRINQDVSRKVILGLLFLMGLKLLFG